MVSDYEGKRATSLDKQQNHSFKLPKIQKAGRMMMKEKMNDSPYIKVVIKIKERFSNDFFRDKRI